MGDQQYPSEKVTTASLSVVSRIVGSTHPHVAQPRPPDLRKSVRAI
jgi:hypothetical protein